MDAPRRYGDYSARAFSLGQHAAGRSPVTAGGQPRRTRWLLTFGGLVALAAGGIVALPWLLIAPPEMMPADVILHLAIDPHSDADRYVAELYTQGIAPRILCVSSHVSCDVYPADYAGRHLVAMGVPEGAVATLHLPITDCWTENVTRVVEHVQTQGWTSALLVVGPIGSRPRKRLTQRYFDQAGIRVALTYSPRDREDFVHQWWRTHAKAQRMISAAMNAVLDLLYPQCQEYQAADMGAGAAEVAVVGDRDR